MKYRFCGDKLQLVKFTLSVEHEANEITKESYVETFNAVSEKQKEMLLRRYPTATVTEVDNSGYEWLDGKVFTQEQIKSGEVETAIRLGKEEYEKYLMESDPTYQMLDLDLRVTLLETGVNLDDLQAD